MEARAHLGIVRDSSVHKKNMDKTCAALVYADKRAAFYRTLLDCREPGVARRARGRQLFVAARQSWTESSQPVTQAFQAQGVDKFWQVLPADWHGKTLF